MRLLSQAIYFLEGRAGKKLTKSESTGGMPFAALLDH